MQKMPINPDIENYINALPSDRKSVLLQLQKIASDCLPIGFEAQMSYGMIGYVVPHTIYPQGYHCNPKLPLPFFSMASQKNSINLYHMMLYADKSLHDWFVAEYPKHCKSKLDIGKSCIRFKKLDEIPYQLIVELLSKITVQQWISCYEKTFLKTS
jgi:Domain of unknown function (DU1801)